MDYKVCSWMAPQKEIAETVQTNHADQADEWQRRYVCYLRKRHQTEKINLQISHGKGNRCCNLSRVCHSGLEAGYGRRIS